MINFSPLSYERVPNENSFQSLIHVGRDEKCWDSVALLPVFSRQAHELKGKVISLIRWSASIEIPPKWTDVSFFSLSNSPSPKKPYADEKMLIKATNCRWNM